LWYSVEFGDLTDINPEFAKMVHAEVLSDKAVEDNLLIDESEKDFYGNTNSKLSESDS
jgi:hypothetical protein